MTKPLLGLVPAEAIRLRTVPKPSADLLACLDALDDLTASVSDALDNLGLPGAVPASMLAPVAPGQRMIGPALTVRNVERAETVTRAAASGKGQMGEREAFHLAETGDVIVIEGLIGISNLGGQSAAIAHRQGCAGVVIDGSYRDPRSARALGFPIWGRGITPITGKWRLRTTEINGAIRVAGIAVCPGDLVVADEAGVVFVPRQHAEAVVAEAEKIALGDKRQRSDIDGGVPLDHIARTRYK